MPPKRAKEQPRRVVEPKRGEDPDWDLECLAETWRARALATGKPEDRGVATVLDALMWLAHDPDPTLEELQKIADAYSRRRVGAPTFRRRREVGVRLAKVLERYIKSNAAGGLPPTDRVAEFACAILERDGLASDDSISLIAKAIQAVNTRHVGSGRVGGLIEKGKRLNEEDRAEQWTTAIWRAFGFKEANTLFSSLNKPRAELPKREEFDLNQLQADMAHPDMVAARAKRTAELEAQFPMHAKKRPSR